MKLLAHFKPPDSEGISIPIQLAETPEAAKIRFSLYKQTEKELLEGYTTPAGVFIKFEIREA